MVIWHGDFPPVNKGATNTPKRQAAVIIAAQVDSVRLISGKCLSLYTAARRSVNERIQSFATPATDEHQRERQGVSLVRIFASFAQVASF
jgi:hypothetical protein